MKTCSVLGLAAILALSGCASAPAGDAKARRFTDPTAYDQAFPPALVELNFESAGDRLNGQLYLADGAGPHPAVVLLHGFPGNEKNMDLAQVLRRDGFNVLTFHYRGAWGSAGTYTFTHVIEDVAAATDFLRANAGEYRTDPDKLILIGHSMGGFAALQGAARDPRIACTAGIAPADLGAMGRAIGADPAMRDGFAGYSDTLQMLAGFNGETAIAEILANGVAFDTRAIAPNLAGKKVLLVGADKDEAVPLEHIILPLIEAYESQPGIELTASILSGDHSFSWSRTALINTVVDWAEGCR